MTMSVPMRAIHKTAEEYDKTLLATDPRFRGLVIVNGVNDMANFVYPDAFAVKKNDGKEDWYVVFTEHYGFHVYNAEDYYVAYYTNRIGVDAALF